MVYANSNELSNWLHTNVYCHLKGIPIEWEKLCNTDKTFYFQTASLLTPLPIIIQYMHSEYTLRFRCSVIKLSYYFHTFQKQYEDPTRPYSKIIRVLEMG